MFCTTGQQGRLPVLPPSPRSLPWPQVLYLDLQSPVKHMQGERETTQAIVLALQG